MGKSITKAVIPADDYGPLQACPGDHFDREPGLEQSLAKKGDHDRLDMVQEASELGPIHYVRQGEAKGLGHVILCAAQHVGNEPFEVLLGNDLIDEAEDLLTTMMEVQQKTGGRSSP